MITKNILDYCELAMVNIMRQIIKEHEVANLIVCKGKKIFINQMIKECPWLINNISDEKTFLRCYYYGKEKND
jgi:hypothetical protein